MSSPRLLSNRYEIGDTLGYGGMSEVHRGRDVRLGRDVAVKVLRADLARDPTFQLRFRREAQNAAALNHPAIVAVYDTGETESENGPLPYIVMEYVDGRTLRDIVKAEGPLAPRRAMEVMADASAALDFSHRHGIVHRDVKPANIMITDSGAVKVMDFGIARAVADGQAAVTQTAAVIGTAQYLSPEQARGETVDARSDVYASGCVLFELLTGEPPFTGDSPVAVAYQHVREDPSQPSAVNEEVPAALDAVVLKALSKNPANRYQSAADMRADLVRVLSGQRPKAPMVMSEDERTAMLAGPSATQVAPTTRYDDDYDDEVYDQEQDRRRRKRWTAGLLTVTAVALIALGTWLATLMLGGEQGPKLITLDNHIGQEFGVAQNQLTKQGFTVLVREKPSSEADAGTVVDQSPKSGRYEVGYDITLVKGTGPAEVDVPDLTGMTVQEARQELRDLGLQLAIPIKKEPVTDQSKVGEVIKQGTTGSVPQNSAITVTVGKEIPKKPVPDVVGESVEEATGKLESAGFKVETESVDSTKPEGTVIQQSPAGGSQARPESTVTLKVSNGSLFVMPELRGMTPEEAKQALEEAGFRGEANFETVPTDNRDLDEKVVKTAPEAGSKVNKDSEITIYFGDYDPFADNGGEGDGDDFPL